MLLKKDALEKAATIKRFEYSTLGSESKNKSGIVGKQYRGLKRYS